MTQQTESYIVLKPIAERFSSVANSITDDDLKYIIKDELRKQIQSINFGGWISDVLSDWVDENVETITDLAKKCVTDRLLPN